MACRSAAYTRSELTGEEMIKRVSFLIVVFVLGLSPIRSVKAALSADEVRGGWIADIDGQRHVYLLNVRGTDVRGIYCWDCSNPQNLSFVTEGKFDSSGVSFVLLHD